jgi:hypothetical protein
MFNPKKENKNSVLKLEKQRNNPSQKKKKAKQGHTAQCLSWQIQRKHGQNFANIANFANFLIILSCSLAPSRGFPLLQEDVICNQVNLHKT